MKRLKFLFLSDVLVAVAPLDLKVPTNIENKPCNLICCKTNAQQRDSTGFAAMLLNKLHVFCCPFYNYRTRDFSLSCFIVLEFVPKRGVTV